MEQKEEVCRAVQAPGAPSSILDTGKRPKVSVVLGVRNEYPVILGTILSFVEEFEFWGYPYEIIVVDNMSTDSTTWILKDKFRRWCREKPPLLKVVEYNDGPANVKVRNLGAREATGEVVFLGDGHLSIKTGTCHGMIQGWLRRGGLWHSAINIWGDTTDIKCYGYDLKLEERFWGNLCRGIPDQAFKDGVSMPYRVPMASHCCLMAGREEYLDVGGYNESFRCYGGGEPYLDLKWWLFGKEVWIFSEGLVRHAFGVNAAWRTVDATRMGRKHKELLLKFFSGKVTDAEEKKTILRQLPRSRHTKVMELDQQDISLNEKMAACIDDWPRVIRSRVQCKDGTQRSELEKGDEHLHYSRGYFWTNEQFQYNFMLSAFTIGGYKWLKQRYEQYFEGRKGNPRYVEELQQLRKEVIKNGLEDRKFIESRQVMSLDELLVKKPWENFSDI